MIINIHAGHNPDGKIACGAVKLIKESTEARKVTEILIQKLKSRGHTVYDCTVNDGISQSDVLSKIVKKENANRADLDVSIHFNAGGGEGVEVYCYNDKSAAIPYATKICEEVAKLGYKNRGVKFRSSLYVLRYSHNPALLIECCFVDSSNDVARYNAETMANAIANAIAPAFDITPRKNKVYAVQVGAFSNKDNALNLIEELTAKGYIPFLVEKEVN